MFKNYLLIALRNLWKNKVASIIKIAGLAIGLTSVLLIYLYISFEYSYDNYHENKDRIYRVAYTVTQPDIEYRTAKTGHNLSAMLQNNFPEIEATTHVSWMGEVTINKENQQFNEPKFLFGEPSILTLFSFPMKQGNRKTALNERRSVIISSRIAKKYFGNENPLGKFLDDNLQLKVTGVVDVPDNSHFRFDILASYSTIYDLFPYYKWEENKLVSNREVHTYIMLRKDFSKSAFEKKLPPFEKTYFKNDENKSIALFIEPLNKIHFESDTEASLGEFQLSKFTNYIVTVFEILALIIIGIACFNFINIAIAQIIGRSKEVGVRKVYGSEKKEIFFQFIYEYGLYSLIAIIISIIIARALTPLISSLLNRQISINYLQYIVASSTILLLVTLIAGAYPSFIVAKVNPVKALQSGFKGPRGNRLKSVLVISQFSISIILILSTLFMSKQIRHYTEMDMGINTQNLVVVRMNHPKIKENYELLKSELLSNPNILSVSASSNVPAVGGGANRVKVKIDGTEEKICASISIDAEFIKNLEIKTIYGRSFNGNSSSDGQSTFLLNQTAADEFGLTNPAGKVITLFENKTGESKPLMSGQVIGVISNYSYRANYETSKGVVFNIEPNRFGAMLIRINPNNQKDALAMIELTGKKFFPEKPLTINFLEDEIKNDFMIQNFNSVNRVISLTAIFSFIIALLGLFSLSIFSAKQRIKEIGIRRVNGASLWQLLVLMNKKLLYWVILSMVISFPVSFLIIENIKMKIEKNADLSLFNYASAFLLIIIFTVLTVSWQSWKAATKNPVESLRYE